MLHDHERGLIEQVARRLHLSLGPKAIGYLREQAEISEAIGDAPSAAAWRDIAAAVDSITDKLLVQLGPFSD